MAPSKFCPGSVFFAVGIAKLEQLSIGAVDKKRDFRQNRLFHHGNFFELVLEKYEEMHCQTGSIPAHVFVSKSIASSAI
jgi:hypothetical protein